MCKNGGQLSKKTAALLSILSNSALVIFKLVVGFFTGSVSVMSEAIHSGIDLLASGMAFAAVQIAAQPADKEHAFGHAKVENLSPAAALDLQMDLLAKGVAIVAANPQSYSGNYGFQPGDIVKSVNGAAINRVGDLSRALNGVNHWDLVIERGGRRLTLSVDG